MHPPSRSPRPRAPWLALLLVLAAALPAAAQRPDSVPLDSLRARLRLPPPPVVDLVLAGRSPAPATSLGSPTAFGAELGDAFVGLSYQARTRYTNLADGSVAAGFGLGDRGRWVGLEVVVTSFSTLRGSPVSSGALSVKLHRLLPGSAGVAAGVEGAVPWGDTDGGTSAYAVASKLFKLRRRMDDPFGVVIASAGVGSGRFRSEADVVDGAETVSPFGNLSLRVVPRVSVVADWTGQDLNLGGSLTLLRGTPLVATVGLADVTHRAGDGARWIAGLGYGFPLPAVRR